MSKRKIITRFINPPIPVRSCDWVAFREGNDNGPFFWANTEAEAIAELKENEEPKTMTPQEYDRCFAQGDSINKI